MTSRDIPSIFEEALVRQHQQDSHYRFTLEWGLFIVFLFGSFLVCVNNLNYNTLFLDEAIYAGVGKDLLHGIYSHNAVSYLSGSYLYPVMTAVVNKAGGITGMRMASAVLMCLASVFVYFATRRLFGTKAGLFSMLLFSFSGNILNLGKLAVYDSLALPFLAAALFLLATAATSPKRQKHLLSAASACAILAILSKYISLFYLPALFMTAMVLLWLRGTPLRQALITLFNNFVLPVVYVLSLYAAFYRRELIDVFQEQRWFSLASQWQILKLIGQEIGFILLLALAGLVLLVLAFTHNRNHTSQLPLWSEQVRIKWYKLHWAYRALFFALLLFLICTWLAAPLQQWLTANNRSLWKNSAYSLIFLSPLAGYCVAAIIESLRSRNLAINVIGVALLCAGTFYFADKSLDSNWSFHQSWPNIEAEMAYLRKAGLDENSRVLAEGMNVYEYYFASELDKGQVWNNFWYMDYGEVSGQEGTLAAIRDSAFDFIIMDDYYFPGIRERAAPILAKAGYVLGWQEEQKLRTGETILMQVFIPSDGGAQ
jgi:hypothetical protein